MIRTILRHTRIGFIRLIPIVALVTILAVDSTAQILSTEGIAGDIDLSHRNPRLTINATAGTTEARITADAVILNKEYRKYPIIFKFYVNGTLFEEQIRSPGLPRAIGITVPRSRASLPFNYTVVATVIHPNRQYPTMIEGALFEQALTVTLACTVTRSIASILDGGTEQEFTAPEVVITQPANGAMSLDFTAKDSSGAKITVTGDLSLNDEDELSGSLTLTESGVARTVAFSGQAELKEKTLESFSIATEDDEITIACE